MIAPALVTGTNTYGSCWWLQDHLAFNLDGGLTACCFSFVNKQGQARGSIELVKIGDENRFPADEVLAARAQAHAQIVAGEHDHCSTCPALVVKEWAPRRYLAKFITMNVWSHCNLACQYCFTTAPGFKYSRVKYDTVAVVADMLEGEYVDPTGTVTWGGGDISALPEFNALSRLFIDYGIKQQFKTSGAKLLKGVADAIAVEKGSVEISVDAGTRESYAVYKGKDMYDAVVGNILHYREHGAVALKYIIDGPNMSEADIDGWVDLIDKVRPSVVTLSPEYRQTWQNRVTDEMVDWYVRFLEATQATGYPVQPSGDAEGPVLFPNGVWARMRERQESRSGVTLGSGSNAAGVRELAC